MDASFIDTAIRMMVIAAALYFSVQLLKAKEDRDSYGLIVVAGGFLCYGFYLGAINLSIFR